MKRTSHVKLTLVASLAAFLTGCGPDPKSIRRCVGADDRVADDWYCTDDYRLRGGTAVYRFYYGGPIAYVPVGTFVSGGSYSAPAGVIAFTSPTAEGATSRGVVGAAGDAHGGGAGEGAGD
jgi:hypothetical protein